MTFVYTVLVIYVVLTLGFAALMLVTMLIHGDFKPTVLANTELPPLTPTAAYQELTSCYDYKHHTLLWLFIPVYLVTIVLNLAIKRNMKRYPELYV